MNTNAVTKQIVGYADEISAVPGQSVRFMISCDGVDSYEAELVRLVHGDVNPEGPGFKSEDVTGVPVQTFQGRKQNIQAGSYAVVPHDSRLDLDGIEGYGWSAGMYGFIVATVVMVAAGFMKPSEDHVSALWEDISVAKTHARALARERSAAGSEA